MPRPNTAREPLSQRLSALWSALREYFGAIGRRRDEPVKDAEALRRFLDTRASYVAQTSLYGYLRTRAGMRYPELFDDDEFVHSINIAKWHVWLACLSDLAVYAGGLLARQSQVMAPEVGALMRGVVGAILEEKGVPPDADAEFAAHAERVRGRVAACDWAQVSDGEKVFSESPTALVRHAPVVENLKELDEEIVRNSVRFRWQEVRRDLRRNLEPDVVLQAAR